MNSIPPGPATAADGNQVRPGELQPVKLGDHQDRLTNEAAPSEYTSWFRQLFLPQSKPNVEVQSISDRQQQPELDTWGSPCSRV